MKRSLTLVSAFFVVFLVGTGLGYSLVNPARYKGRIDALENEVSDLNGQISALKEAKSGLELQLSQIEQQSDVEVLGVYFSPKGGCEDQVLYWISRANVSIHVLIYSFTLDSIGEALAKAHDRGVEVQAVFEKSQVSRYSEYQRLKAAGIAVCNDTNSKLMHDKIMIIDGVILMTGSFNWSKNAENYNNENLVIIRSTYIATVYEAEFQKIWNQSV